MLHKNRNQSYQSLIDIFKVPFNMINLVLKSFLKSSSSMISRFPASPRLTSKGAELTSIFKSLDADSLPNRLNQEQEKLPGKFKEMCPQCRLMQRLMSPVFAECWSAMPAGKAAMLLRHCDLLHRSKFQDFKKYWKPENYSTAQ
jgi:hypothetical protein